MSQTPPKLDRLADLLLRSPLRSKSLASIDWDGAGISNRKTFFELMRRLESLLATDGYGLRPGWDRDKFYVEQAADLSFASSELQAVDIVPGPNLVANESGEARTQIRIRCRHFGLFAPYGPLPVHITEHARHEILFERNAAFESLINTISGHLAVLYYRAFANTHPLISQRAHPQREGFNQRLARLASPWMGGNELADEYHIKRCRQHMANAYLRPERSLDDLKRLLEMYFGVDVHIVPRHGRWIEIGHDTSGSKRLGAWRIGQRVFDTQSSLKVTIGPLKAQDFPDFQRASARMKTMVRLIDDFVGGQATACIDVAVQTTPELGSTLGRCRIGQNAWLKPSQALKTVRAYDPAKLS